MDIPECLADLLEHLLQPALCSLGVGCHGGLEVLGPEVVHGEIRDGIFHRQECLGLEFHFVDLHEVGVLEQLSEFEFLFELGQDCLGTLFCGGVEDFFTDQLEREVFSSAVLDHFEYIADLASGDVTNDGELINLEYVVRHWVRPANGNGWSDLSHCRHNLWPQKKTSLKAVWKRVNRFRHGLVNTGRLHDDVCDVIPPSTLEGDG